MIYMKKAVIVYLEEKVHRELKARLALEGNNVSRWTNEEIKKYLKTKLKNV
jgi:uncharacterized protein YacL (UPF0231 family)